jgi:hypothetical protein
MSMGPLMPMVLEPLARATGATFELVTVENDHLRHQRHDRRPA